MPLSNLDREDCLTANKQFAGHILWLAIAYVGTRAPFVYRAGFPDGDQQHIALGVLDAVLRGSYFEGVRLYGVNFSFGYYAAHFSLASLYRAHPDLIFAVMNWSGAVAGIIALLAIAKMAKTLWGTSAAVAVSWCWMLTPGWWELTTFGHPSTIALSLFLCALMSFASYLSRPSNRAMAIASGLLYFVTLTVRADFLLGAPVFLILPTLRPRREAFLAGGLTVVLGAGLFALAYALLFADTGHSGSTTFVGRALVVRDQSMRVAVKELVVWILGLGPVLFALGLAGIARLLWRSDSRRTAVVLLLGLAPSLAWWLQVEGPFRHLLLPSFLVVAAAGLLIAEWSARDSRRTAGIALIVLVLNQLFSAALYPQVLARYPWTYQAVTGERRWSTRTPLGDWLSNHIAATRGVAREASEAEWLASSAPDSVLVLTPSPYRTEFELLSRFPGSYRYSRLDSPRPGVDYITLVVPNRTTSFLVGDPLPVAQALATARQGGELRVRAAFLPAGAVPTNVQFPLAGMQMVGIRRAN